MKVLFINTLYYPNIVGGAERSVQFLAEALVHESHNSVVISTMPGTGVQTGEVNGVKVYYVGLKNFYWPFRDKQNPALLKPFWHLIDSYNPFMAKEVDKIIEKERPDVVHTNNLAGFSVTVWPVVKRRGLSLVHTIRDYYLLCPASNMFKHNSNCEKQCGICRIYSKPRGYYSNLVNVVVGNSKFILEKHILQGLFPSAKQRVVFNAYKSNSVPVISRKHKPMRFGYIGQLNQAKGVEFILKAIMNSNIENFTLDVAGRGNPEYENYLKKQSTSNVCFLGFVQPENFFSQIDVLFVPSLWHEPLPRTIFEAYSYGIPVVGSNRGGIPELIEEGRTGFLFDPDRPEEFLKIIVKLVNNPDLVYNMREACLKKAEEFTPERIIKQYLQVYFESLEKDC
ncbi:glycosyltransferase family 4 protein [Desulfoscipio geothermicus]|nr:glycosyltransferase family 4 protein [Desulfoscipio geothermicus]